MEHIDVINFLTGSQARWQILLALRKSPREFTDLRHDLDVPQSTLNRNLTKLTAEGWVHEETDRTYRLTSLGTFFVDRFEPLSDVLTIVDQLAEHPEAFPLTEFGFDVTRLADADWLEAGDNQPYTVINRIRAILEEATTIHGFTPIYNPAYIDVAERVASREDGEIIGLVPDHQLEAAIDDEHFDLSQFRDIPSVEFRVWEGDIDYAVAIVDDERVIYTGEHEGGMPSIMFETDDAAVLRWTRATWNHRYEQSKEVHS